MSWSIPSWSSGVDYNSPDIKTIVQEVVNRSNWSSGKHLAVLIRSDNIGGEREIRSYDGSSETAPLLHVEYTPVAPPAANRLLFVVGDSGGLTPQETARKSMFQAFGYTVALISAGDSQAAFDTSAAANDVAYVSREITAAALGTKLKAKKLGVVNEHPELADDFAVASSCASPLGFQLTVASNSHYITAPFATGALDLTTSSQLLSACQGTLAAERSVPATIGGVAALCAVEINGKLNDGTRAAGRRVQMPWGGSGFDFNTLAPDGITLLSRALAWAGGVVAYWKLDETSGTLAADSSNYGNTGTLQSGLSFSNNSVSPAKVGNGLNFDGENDYVSVPHNAALSLTKEMTISAWIYVTDLAGWNVIVNKGTGNSTSNYHFELGDGRLDFAFYEDGWNSVYSPNTLAAGQWHHVAVTMEIDGTGRRFRFYENGVEVANEVSAEKPKANTQALQLGSWYTYGENFAGYLDEVRIFNHALRGDEIAALKSQGQRRGVRIVKWREIP